MRKFLTALAVILSLVMLLACAGRPIQVEVTNARDIGGGTPLTAARGDTNLTNLVASGTGSFGGGYGSTGCSISAAGVLQCDGALTTDAAITADNAVITAGATFGAAVTCSDELGITRTTTADTYTELIDAYWQAGADMAAGGSNGIYSWSNPVEDVSNAYALRGRMDLRKAAGDVAVNQLHAVDALINLNETQTYTVDNNASVMGAAIHGGTSGGMLSNMGGDSATLNLFYGEWGPTATEDFGVQTNGLFFKTHNNTVVDYGVNIQSSSNMTAGVYLNSHAINSGAKMDYGVLMTSGDDDMVSGIDMSAADFSSHDVIFSNGEYISNVTDGQIDIGTGDVVLLADTTGGNLGAKNEFIGLPRIKMTGVGTGSNPVTQTLSLVDDSPLAEWAPISTTVAEAITTTIVKHGTNSYHMAWGADAVATHGIIDAALGANASWEDMESCGMLVRSDTAWASGDLTLVLTDDGGARTFAIPALTTVNTWVWLEINITSLDAGTGDIISDVAILMSAQGATALGAFNMYLDIMYVWDADDEEALGVAIQQDGVLGVVDPADGTNLVELTDYLVHTETGVDFLVWITDQSAAYPIILVAY